LDDTKKWFTSRFKNEFIAIVTGQISNLLVVDCDTEEAYEKIQEFIPEYLVTPTAKSPHGFHLYFKHRSGLINRANYMPGIDIRTDGGCIIAPPSKNGDGLSYQWMPGLSILEVEPAAMPDYLYDTLLQYINNSIYNNANGIPNKNTKPQTDTTTTNDHKFFVEGRRDQDIFHAANCLVKGRCERNFSYEILKILGKNCEPPFDEKEIETKLKSAEGRQNVRERNLAAEIREWVATTNGYFSTTNGHNELHLTTKDEKKNFNMVMLRLVADGIIEKSGTRNGEYRLIDHDCKPEDWLNTKCDYMDIWLPLGLGEICGVLPGNIMVFAGSKDAGKTAFLLNIAKENRHRYKINYINSEMGNEEFHSRIKLFDDITPEQFSRNFYLYNKSSNFHDYVKPGKENLNIIDYLEAPDKLWEIGSFIRKIHDKLNGSLCVIGIQKKIGQDLGRGAEFSMEKARLYISLEYGKAKIISCKNFKDNELIRGNPRGYTTNYKVVNGSRIMKVQPGWTSPE
jgi:hypothetical protein